MRSPDRRPRFALTILHCDRIHALAEDGTLAEGMPDPMCDDRRVVDVFLGDAYEQL